MKGSSAGISFALALWLALSATALPAKKGEGKKHKGSADGVQIAVEVFIGKDQEVIRNYYTHSGQLPPGLAKRGGDLPPGLEKHLRRNGRLPPGLQKKLDPFPIELEEQLAPLKKGLIRGMIGGRAVIYDQKSKIVVDVLALL